MNKNLTGLPSPANAFNFDSKERQSYIAPGGLYLFLSSLSKRMEGYIHVRLLGGVGAKPSAIIILTDGMEDETEQINDMEPDDSTLVCNSNKHLKEYKTYFGDPE